MYVPDYRRLNDQQRKNIYNAYANVIEKLELNQDIRNDITGIIFENEKCVFTFKVYKPSNINDKRLTYEPIEIVKIGVNNKTTIPIKILNINNIPRLNFNVINSNVFGEIVFDSSVDSDIVLDSNE